MGKVIKTFDFSVLQLSKARVCTVQTSGPTAEVISADAARPAAVRTASDLLQVHGGRTRLTDILGDDRPPIVVFPEYTFGSPDWVALDQVVRNFPGPLLLFVGFGATPSNWLTTWAAGQSAESPTIRTLIENPLPDQIYNGGWCWIKSGANATPECVAYFKGFAEQNIEEVNLDVSVGSRTLVLEFPDLVIIPAICADLLCTQNDGPKQTIINAAEGYNAKSVLVIGSLYQALKPAAFGAWGASVAELCNADATVILCNHAQDKPLYSEPQDSWRSISGIYTKGSADLAAETGSKGTRPHVLGAVSAMMVRRTHPVVTLGYVLFPPYGAQSGKHLWPSKAVIRIRDDGALDPDQISFKEYDYELERFTLRLPLPDPRHPMLEAGIKIYPTHLSSHAAPRANVFVSQGLKGVLPDDEGGLPPADKIMEAEAALSHVVFCSGFLLASGTVAWQPEEAIAGQLKWSDGSANILVWYDAQRLPHSVRLALQAWADQGGSHPPLHVIVGTAGGDVKPGLIEPKKRTNFTQPANDTGRDITAAKAFRKTWITILNDVAVVYRSGGGAAEVDALVTLLKSRL